MSETPFPPTLTSDPTPPPQTKANLLFNIDRQAEALLHTLPRYEHIINNKIYNPTMARKQVLQSPCRANLANTVGGFSAYREACAKVLAELFSTTDVSADLQAADSALDCATRTSSVIAAVNTAEEFRGTSRGRDMASMLLAKSSAHIPDKSKHILMDMASG